MTVTTEKTLLGKNIKTKTQYDPSILVRVEREVNRKAHGITTRFMDGYDVWSAYECSTLTSNGLPVYFIMNLSYSSDSKYLVESKSLKLYINSFNMTKMTSNTIHDSAMEMRNKIQNDLSNLLETPVSCQYIEYSAAPEYTSLLKLIAYDNIKVSEYKVNPDILKATTVSGFDNLSVKFDGFRSNCKVTKAPDYASVYIKYMGPQCIDPESLVKYLSSYRNEEHLHEECCEMIFSHLYNKFGPSNLRVMCCYTRRGGIDITPIRFIKETRFFSIDAPIIRTKFQ